MGLLDKLKNVWKRISDLDDESGSLSAETGTTDRIHYRDISKKLKEIMKQNVDVLGRRILIPQYYAIHFSEADRQARLEVEDVLCHELKEELFYEMRKINPEQSKQDLHIVIQTDASLAKGDFKIVHRVKKPMTGGDETEDSTAPPAGTVKPPDLENDQKQTVKEIDPLAVPGDEQDTVIQMDAHSVLYKLIIDSGKDEKEERIVTKDVISIGRSSKDDIILQSPDFTISRTHAIIKVKNGDFYLLPSGSNGTLLNGEDLELKKEVKISPGDEVGIANFTLTIAR